MTRIARVEFENCAYYAALVDEEARLIEGDPFTGSRQVVRTVALDGVTLLPPLTPSKIFAVGRNYREHAQEMGSASVSEPPVFMKPPTSVVGPNQSIELPSAALSSIVEHEAELAVVIGKRAKRVNAESAADHIFGYTCANDISARDLQKRDPHVIRAKGFDTFCPLGPWIETELDAGAVRIQCTVNGELRQDESSSAMIFGIPTIIASISRWATLLPGDVILTGSPGGTGALADGDTVAVAIEGIGTLTNNVRAVDDEDA